MTGKPKGTVEKISSEVGGMLCATASGQLPRNEMQVSNQRKKQKLDFGGSTSASDDLFAIMQTAHTQDLSKKFVRDIKTSPEPAIVLAENQQLQDLVHFGTSSSEFSIMTIDPTFNLGAFDVTPITYRHLLLETRRSKQPPIFLGPVMIHYKKTFASYLFFASSLVGQCRQLQGIRAFGTDGEKPLADAFSHEFGFSQHLTCFIHVRRNIKEKLCDCNVPSSIAQIVLDDIFGRRVGTAFEEGLVDSLDNDQFQSNLDALLVKWHNLESSSNADIECFLDWFRVNKVSVIRDTMLRPIREECGLGNPPATFTTNPSESINAMLKQKVDYEKSSLPVFVDKVKELIAEQQKELERAVVNRGKYKFRQQYEFFQISETQWFTMTTQQRAKHLAKIQSADVVDSLVLEDDKEDTETGKEKEVGHNLSISADEAREGLNIPITCLEGVWKKATELLRTDSAMSSAPGQESEARMVLSYSGKTPHLVVPTKQGGFSCDSNCPSWKSIGVCSHVVAVAEVNGKLSQLVAYLKQKKKSPNVTNLVTSGMPRGRGRKGSAAPRSRKRPSVCEPVNRVPLNAASPQAKTSSSVSPSSLSQAACRPPAMYSPAHHTPPTYGLPLPQIPSVMSQPPSAAYPSSSFMYSPTNYATSPSGVYAPYWGNPYMATNPFTVYFISGNISVCIGCKNRYPKSRQPPQDLCIRHQEWRTFTPRGREEDAQERFGNVYYHCNPQCIWLRCPDFIPSTLDVNEVQENLSTSHKEHLNFHFGLTL